MINQPHHYVQTPLANRLYALKSGPKTLLSAIDAQHPRYPRKSKYTLLMLMGLTTPSILLAQKVDMSVLMNVMVEEKVISKKKAERIKQKTLKRMKQKQKAQAKHKIEHDSAGKQALNHQNVSTPRWMRTLSINGDLRLRYETRNRQRQNDLARNRFRLRYRLGLISEISPSLKVGAGLASGSDDPRSTNQSLDSSFSTKSIRLDYAFAQWAFNDHVTLLGGKYERDKALWQATDMLWDSDINPEGASLALNMPFLPRNKSFLNTGAWILEENSNQASDPYMAYIQTGFDQTFNDHLSLKGAISYYWFDHIQGDQLQHSAGTNTTDSQGDLIYTYNATNLDLALNMNNFGNQYFNHAGLFGAYVHNLDNDATSRNGWQTGINLGHKSVNKAGQWQLTYSYTWLGRNAFLDTFPDSDRLGGATDVKGSEIILTYGLYEHTKFVLDYYHSQRIDADGDPQNLLQADIKFDF